MNTTIKKLLIILLSATLALFIYGCKDKGKTGDVSLDSLLVSTPNNVSPIAIAGKDITVKKGASVTVNGTASYDTDGSIVSYKWQMLDGTVFGNEAIIELSTSEFPAGTYEIVLVVTDDEGATGVDTLLITITRVNVVPTPSEPKEEPEEELEEEPEEDPENQAPVANAGEAQTIGICDALIMDGTESSDSDGSIVSYVWSVSDGLIILGEGATVTLSMVGRTPGNHTITLTVTDDDGATSIDTIEVTVNGADEDYDFSYIITNPSALSAQTYIVNSSNIRLGGGADIFWQPDIGGTSLANTTPGIIDMQFNFPGNVEIAYLSTRIDSFHWEYSRGHTYLHGSVNGTNWDLLDEAQPPAFGVWNGGGYNDFVPNSMIGGTDIWVRAELYSYGPSASSGSVWTNTAQFLRHNVANGNTTFKLNVCHE